MRNIISNCNRFHGVLSKVNRKSHCHHHNIHDGLIISSSSCTTTTLFNSLLPPQQQQQQRRHFSKQALHNEYHQPNVSMLSSASSSTTSPSISSSSSSNHSPFFLSSSSSSPSSSSSSAVTTKTTTTRPPPIDAPLLSLLRWGDDYLSAHLNNNNNNTSRDHHNGHFDGIDNNNNNYSSFSDYHDESLQLLAHVLHLDYQTAKQKIYMQKRSRSSNNNSRFSSHSSSDSLSQVQYEQFQHLIRERAENHVPLQYLIGTCHFYGREFIVNSNVLIPRPDSEILIDATLHQVHHRMKDSVLRILDIGTGSGCLVTSLLCELRKERDHHATSAVALDNSYEALHVARQNATRLLPNMNSIFFVHQNILKLKDPAVEALGSFNVIISNPPYIKTSVIPQLAPEVKDYEPRGALDGGEDGLIFYRHIVKMCDQVGGILEDNGILALEMGYDQSHDVQQLIFASQNLSILSVNKDLAGIDRVIVVLKSATEEI